jgi:hypothetical protein
VFDDHVDETLDEARERTGLQRDVRIAVRDQQPAQGAKLERRRRKQEAHFVEPPRRIEIREPHARHEFRVHDVVDEPHHHRRQPHREVGLGLDRPVVQRAERGLAPRIGLGEATQFEQAVQALARRSAARKRQDVVVGRRRHDRVGADERGPRSPRQVHRDRAATRRPARSRRPLPRAPSTRSAN